MSSRSKTGAPYLFTNLQTGYGKFGTNGALDAVGAIGTVRLVRYGWCAAPYQRSSCM